MNNNYGTIVLYPKILEVGVACSGIYIPLFPSSEKIILTVWDSVAMICRGIIDPAARRR